MRGYHLFAEWLAECEPNRQWELVDIYIPIRPFGKERPRGDRHGTPVKTRMWEDYVGGVGAYDYMRDKPSIGFPCAAEILFGINRNRSDIDNLEKLAWDAMQRGDKSGKGRVIADDRFIRGYVRKGEREMPKGEEFIWARFYARREEDYLNYIRELENVQNQDAGY